MARLALLLLLAVLARGAWCATPIAIETFFREPQLEGLQLSPDGKHLAAIVPQKDRRNLAILDLSKMQAKVITGFNDQEIVRFTWLSEQRLLVDVGDVHDASGLVHLTAYVAINADGSDDRRLSYGTTSVVHRFDNGEALVVGRHGASSAVFRVDTRSGARQLVTFDNPGSVTRWVADSKGNVRAAVNYDSATRTFALHYRPGGEGAWKEIARFAPGEGTRIFPLVFDADDRHLIVSALAQGEDHRAIWRYDPERAQLLDKLAERDAADVGRVLVDPRTHRVVGAVTGNTPSGVTWFEPRWQSIQDGVDKALPNLRNLLSWGENNPDRVLVASWSYTQPTKWWLLDVSTGKLQELPSSRRWIDPAAMTPVERVAYRARDGLSISTLLAVPRRDDGAKPPLVVLIHGGPYAPGYGLVFNAELQFLASRGYAVLAPDFRGTTGYGRAFLEAGFGQWGRAMQDDITDGVKWAIAQAKVDGTRVCLFGASYGGYAALMGLVREPDLFRCGIAEVAVTDLSLLFDPGWVRGMNRDDFEAEMKRRIGDPARDKAYFDEASPVRRAAAIRQPVLLAFGGRDERVPIVHGTRMRSALEASGTPVEWVMYPDEAHGFNKMENKLDFYGRVEAFLAKHLAQ